MYSKANSSNNYKTNNFKKKQGYFTLVINSILLDLFIVLNSFSLIINNKNRLGEQLIF